MGKKGNLILKFDDLSSTNSFLKQNVGDFIPYTTIWADGQEKGRGRHNRSWISKKGKDLTFSILIPLEKLAAEYWKNLTQITALAISDELEKINCNSLIKWPNDILVNNKKICGILCEVIEKENKSFAVLGVGLNVNSDRNDLASVDQPYTSIFLETGKMVDREALINSIVESVISMVKELMINGFRTFKDSVKLKTAWKNELRTIKDGEDKFKGRIIDLDDDGTLIFQKDDGQLVNLISGEISFIKN